MNGGWDRCVNAFTQNSRKSELFYNDRKPENGKGMGRREGLTKAHFPFFMLMISWEYVKSGKILL